MSGVCGGRIIDFNLFLCVGDPMMRCSLLVLLMLCVPVRAAEHQADVVVYGGTASGAIAAIAVAREGKSVLLVEPGKHIGGMVTGGLGATDTGNRAAIGGYSREYFERVRDIYAKKHGKTSQQVKDCSDGYRFAPSVATLAFQEMLAEAKVQPMFGQRLVKVEKKADSLVSFTTAKGDRFTARVFIDASYEGDLMALAGVKYHVGREGRATYNESLAGVQAYSRAHQWPVAVNGLDANKKPLPFIQSEPGGKAGDGDAKLQAYNYRLCITRVKENQVAFPKPKDYNPARYELLARYLKARPDVKVGQLMNPVGVPDGKTDTNNNGPFSTDHIGANWDYPEATHAARLKIIDDHIRYTQGFLYFLANDPQVPTTLQKEMRSWGLAKDEFTDNDNWPTQLYVREARRMIGAYVMTQTDIMEKLTKDDSVGLGSYNTDSHHVQRVLKADGTVINEGDFQERVTPYAIPYRSLTPRGSECGNLLVPVCCSASHVAYGTIRMEPVYMILGQASGVAAALAVEGKTSVQKIDVAQLTEKLKKQKAVLSPVGLSKGINPKIRVLDPSKMAGVVVDDTKARKTGDWLHSAVMGPFVGEGYLHDGAENRGKMRVRFTPKLTTEGKYEVRLYYAPASNRAGNALVVVSSKEGEKQIRVDQRKAFKGDGLVLGVFAFEAGESGWVEVRNDGADGHVIADAVQFVPEGKTK